MERQKPGTSLTQLRRVIGIVTLYASEIGYIETRPAGVSQAGSITLPQGALLVEVDLVGAGERTGCGTHAAADESAGHGVSAHHSGTDGTHAGADTATCQRTMASALAACGNRKNRGAEKEGSDHHFQHLLRQSASFATPIGGALCR